jgi:CheY-like chemotaxis protein
MTINLICPISLIYPPRIEFGSGTAQVTGQWIRAKGFTRILVVASAFHAARVDQLGLDRSVTVFAEVKQEPDVANLLDVRMPGMGGIELERQLLANHSEIPVVFITSHEEEIAPGQALDGHARTVLIKPFSEEALLNAINNVSGIGGNS